MKDWESMTTELLGDDINDLPEVPEEPTVQLKEEGPTIVDDFLETMVAGADDSEPLPREHQILGTSEKCFFCGQKPIAKFYSPRRSEVQRRGPHGDMIAYNVCNKCLGRCTRKPTLPHTERYNYIMGLEHRGSVRGRVAAPKKAENVPVILSTGQILPQKSLDETVFMSFVVVDEEGVSRKVRASEVQDGILLLYI